MVLLGLFAACTGLLLGSFFNVLIYRLPRNESIFWPPSHCPNCGRNVRPWENIPVISYLILGGKCAGCKQKISIIYPVIELCTGLFATVLFFYFFYTSPATLSLQLLIPVLLQFIFLLLMIPMTIIDIRHYIIPDSFTITLLVCGFGVSFLPGAITPINSLLGILAGGGLLYAVGWLGTKILKKGDAMGGGDIKLMAAAGAVWGVQTSLLAIVFGALLGSLGGILLISLRKISSDHRIPFGPFLGAGIWIAVIAGEQILTLYTGFVDGLMR